MRRFIVALAMLAVPLYAGPYFTYTYESAPFTSHPYPFCDQCTRAELVLTYSDLLPWNANDLPVPLSWRFSDGERVFEDYGSPAGQVTATGQDGMPAIWHFWFTQYPLYITGNRFDQYYQTPGQYWMNANQYGAVVEWGTGAFPQYEVHGAPGVWIVSTAEGLLAPEPSTWWLVLIAGLLLAVGVQINRFLRKQRLPFFRRHRAHSFSLLPSD